MLFHRGKYFTQISSYFPANSEQICIFVLQSKPTSLAITPICKEQGLKLQSNTQTQCQHPNACIE